MRLLEVKVGEPSEWLTPELGSRAANSSQTDYTHHFRVTDDNSEVTFVSLDIRPHEPFIVLYEI